MDGPPARPDHLPASGEELRQFLRRTLFELPPGRLPPERRDGQEDDGASDKGKAGDGQPSRPRLRPVPARKGKLALIETLRDVAVGDAAFAAVVLPLLEEFLSGRGQSEFAATLVAVTQIRHAHASFAAAAEAARPA